MQWIRNQRGNSFSLITRLIAFGVFAGYPWLSPAEPVVHHQITAGISPSDHRIEVADVITLPSGSPRRLQFLLDNGLEVHGDTPGLSLKAVEPAAENQRESTARLYEITLNEGIDSFELNYSGKIFHAIQQQQEEMRVAEVSAGIISDDGVLLDSDAYWYPRFSDELVTFRLEITLPAGWSAVSQGKRIVNEAASDAGRVVWEENHPQDDIYIVAARFFEYDAPAGNISAQVYLREKDEALAGRYLDATVKYLAMYEKLLGPYPYSKFALVENFWQTGYGMPSFTLMGSKIIRFPFIVNSSYPHEILHNWWGNGVFVDYAKGNWSEGLTAYLADHLITEQQGGAAEYRRTALQKYSDFVAENNDFPLVEFTGRHSAATEAVGYGKAMMFFHMLRLKAGDGAFLEAIRKLYGDHRFQRATFDDIRQAFERVTGWDYGRIFDQWTRRTGAPELRLVDASAVPAGGGYRLTIDLEQAQQDEPFELTVPIAVTLDGVAEAYQTVVKMTDRKLSTAEAFIERPLRVDVDPEFDVFRRLAADERPPALSQVFGSNRITVLLPAGASAEMRRRYKQLAEVWPASPGATREIAWDNKTDQLPETGAVVILGKENKFHRLIEKKVGSGLEITHHELSVNGEKYPTNDLSYVIAAGSTRDIPVPVLWVVTDNPGAIPGLVRKLPHYGKYSFVLFNGSEPTNIGRGVWPVSNSSMARMVRYDTYEGVKVERAALAPRHALTEVEISKH